MYTRALLQHGVRVPLNRHAVNSHIIRTRVVDTTQQPPLPWTTHPPSPFALALALALSFSAHPPSPYPRPALPTHTSHHSTRARNAAPRLSRRPHSLAEDMISLQRTILLPRSNSLQRTTPSSVRVPHCATARNGRGTPAATIPAVWLVVRSMSWTYACSLAPSNVAPRRSSRRCIPRHVARGCPRSFVGEDDACVMPGG
jgi:hypothetical protein